MTIDVAGSKTAWYMGLRPGQVAERCVLIGDRGRIDVFAAAMEEPEELTDRRGLRTITGRFDGVPVTVAAFGMGAPIAAVVLEELAALGARVVLRSGTAMSLQPEALALGTFIVGVGGVRREGTSRAYAPIEYPAVADSAMVAAAVSVLRELELPYAVGLIATTDGFYTEMLTPTDAPLESVDRFHSDLRGLGVHAADMETATILVVGRVLGLQAGSLCVVTVDGRRRSILADEARADRERELVRATLATVTRVGTPSAAGDATAARAAGTFGARP